MTKRVRYEEIPFLLFVRMDCLKNDVDCFITPYSSIFTENIINYLNGSNEVERSELVPGCFNDSDMHSTVWTKVEDVTTVENIGRVVVGIK